MEKGSRFHLIDALRGAAVLSMIIYHFAWGLRNLVGIKWGSFSSTGSLIWQQSICWTFILISGFCFNLSKRPLKNGLLTLLGGVAVTLATVRFMPDAAIYFGVLIFHGSAMLLLLPLRKYLYKVPPYLGAALSFLLFALLYGLPRRSIVFGLISLPRFLYANYLTAYLGFPPYRFTSADYFPLLPWIFLFLTGFFLCGIVKKLKNTPKFLYWRLPFLEWTGRKSLIIYLAHQPLIYALTLLIIKIQGA